MLLQHTMVKKVVRRLHYSEEYCYGFRVGLDWKPLTSRDQYSSCAPDSISQTGTTTCLCRLAFIVFQQAAQPFPTAHLFLFSWDCCSPQGEQQEVVFALVISFLMIVGLVVA